MIVVAIENGRTWCLAHLPAKTSIQFVLDENNQRIRPPTWLKRTNKAAWSSEAVSKFHESYWDSFHKICSDSPSANPHKGVVFPGDFVPPSHKVRGPIEVLGNVVIPARTDTEIQITSVTCAQDIIVHSLEESMPHVESITITENNIAGRIHLSNVHVKGLLSLHRCKTEELILDKAAFTKSDIRQLTSPRISIQAVSAKRFALHAETPERQEVEIRSSDISHLYMSLHELTVLKIASSKFDDLGVSRASTIPSKSSIHIEGVDIHGDFTLRGLLFSADSHLSNVTILGSVNWFDSETHPLNRFWGVKFPNHSPKSIGTFRKLRLAYEASRDRIQEGRFFTLEKRSERQELRSGSVEYLLSLFYDVTSEYGQNVGRPLSIFLALNILCFLVYWGAAMKALG